MSGGAVWREMRTLRVQAALESILLKRFSSPLASLERRILQSEEFAKAVLVPWSKWCVDNKRVFGLSQVHQLVDLVDLQGLGKRVKTPVNQRVMASRMLAASGGKRASGATLLLEAGEGQAEGETQGDPNSTALSLLGGEASGALSTVSITSDLALPLSEKEVQRAIASELSPDVEWMLDRIRVVGMGLDPETLIQQQEPSKKFGAFPSVLARTGPQFPFEPHEFDHLQKRVGSLKGTEMAIPIDMEALGRGEQDEEGEEEEQLVSAPQSSRDSLEEYEWRIEDNDDKLDQSLLAPRTTHF